MRQPSPGFSRHRRGELMSLLRNLGSGLRSLFRKEQVNGELDEELGEYLEMADDEKMKQGMSRQDALRAVRLEGGSLDGTKEIVRSGGWESVVDTLWRGLLFAPPLLLKNPRFTRGAAPRPPFGVGGETPGVLGLTPRLRCSLPPPTPHT